MVIASAPAAPSTSSPPSGALACFPQSDAKAGQAADPLSAFVSLITEITANAGSTADDETTGDTVVGKNDKEHNKESIAALFAPAQLPIQDTTNLTLGLGGTETRDLSALDSLNDAIGGFNSDAGLGFARRASTAPRERWDERTPLSGEGQGAQTSLDPSVRMLQTHGVDSVHSLAFALQLSATKEAHAVAETSTTIAASAGTVRAAQVSATSDATTPTAGRPIKSTISPLTQHPAAPQAPSVETGTSDDSSQLPTSAPAREPQSLNASKSEHINFRGRTNNADPDADNPRDEEGDQKADTETAPSQQDQGLKGGHDHSGPGATSYNPLRDDSIASVHLGGRAEASHSTTRFSASLGPQPAAAEPPRTEISETKAGGLLPSTREISMRIAPPDSPSVDIKLIDRAGSVRVAVRTADSDLSRNLQGGLGELVQKLERQGYAAESWTPPDASTARLHTAQINDSGSNQQPGSRDPRDESQQNHGGQQHGSRNRPRWVMELEQTFLNEARQR